MQTATHSCQLIDHPESPGVLGTSAPRHEAREQRFDVLVAEHLPALSRVAYRFCRNRDTAQDLVQETLLRAWRFLDTLRDDAAARSWLFTILRREFARSLAQRPAGLFTYDEEQLADIGWGPSVDGLALHQAIGELPEHYRTPLMLFAFDGYDVREVAERLDIKAATVKTRLFRARSLLRNRLEERP